MTRHPIVALAGSLLPVPLATYATWRAALIVLRPDEAALIAWATAAAASAAVSVAWLDRVQPLPEKAIPIYGRGSAESTGRLNPTPLAQEIKFDINLQRVSGRRRESLPEWLNEPQRAALRALVADGGHPTNAALEKRGPFTRPQYDRFKDEMLKRRLGVERPAAFGKTGWTLVPSAIRKIRRSLK